MYFFEVTTTKQKTVLLKCLPLVKPFIQEFRRVVKMREGGEAAKAAFAAQQELASAEAALMSKNDAVARSQSKQYALDAAIEEQARAQERAIEARIKAVAAFEDAKKEENAMYFDIFESVLENALNVHFDNAIEIVAAFNNQTSETLMQEKDILEIGLMLLDIVTNDKVVDFFTRWQSSKSKMPFGMSQK